MNTPRYINPLTDFGFKKIFGNEDIMRDFLNDIIAPKDPIVSVTFLDKEMKPRMTQRRILSMTCDMLHLRTSIHMTYFPIDYNFGSLSCRDIAR